MFKRYEEFSEKSGLYLNADKTEILKLKGSKEEMIKINIYGQTFVIPTVNKVKICGKTYSLDQKVEEE